MKIKVFDLEMLCWEPKSQTPCPDLPNDIIQFGIAEICLTERRIIRVSDHLVKPYSDRPVSDFCRRLTGITQDKLDRLGRPFEEVLQSITEKFGSKSMYGAWGHDDHTIRKQCEHLNIKPIAYNCINLKLLYQARRNLRRHVGLKKALGMESIEFKGRQHNALVDAIATAEIALKIL